MPTRERVRSNCPLKLRAKEPLARSSSWRNLNHWVEPRWLGVGCCTYKRQWTVECPPTTSWVCAHRDMACGSQMDVKLNGMHGECQLWWDLPNLGAVCCALPGAGVVRHAPAVALRRGIMTIDRNRDGRGSRAGIPYFGMGDGIFQPECGGLLAGRNG